MFTAANGDDLAFTYGVTANGARTTGRGGVFPVGDGSFTAVFVAEFNPVPAKCTGRFAKVIDGSFIMVARSEPFFILGPSTTPFKYTWEGKGWIEFKKGQ